MKALNDKIKDYEKSVVAAGKRNNEREKQKWLGKIADAQYKVANLETELNNMRKALKDVEAVA